MLVPQAFTLSRGFVFRVLWITRTLRQVFWLTTLPVAPSRSVPISGIATGVGGSQLREQLPDLTGFPFAPLRDRIARAKLSCSTVAGSGEYQKISMIDRDMKVEMIE